MKIETIKRKIKEKEELIKSIENNKMINLRIYGTIKRKITRVVESPIDNKLSVAEYLFKDKKERKDLIEKIKSQFPKGSIIEVEEIK